jgi:hypothetical protein
VDGKALHSLEPRQIAVGILNGIGEELVHRGHLDQIRELSMEAPFGGA